MSKTEKLYDKLCKKPTPADIKFDEVDKLMISFGFERRQPSKGGSHYIYTHPKIDECPSIPKKNPVKRAYIKNAVKAIERLMEIDREGVDDDQR